MVEGMKGKSDMESPLLAQKEGAEPGPSAPTGLPPFDKAADPLGIVPEGAGDGTKHERSHAHHGHR